MSNGVAFFDMDLTLIAVNSGRIYARALRDEGALTFAQQLKVAGWLFRYTVLGGDMRAMLERVVADLKGIDERSVVQRCERLFSQQVAPSVYQEALARIAAHKDRGEPVVVLSASTPYVVRLLAEHLGADGWLCTRPHVERGVFTGGFDPPICFGPGKLVWAERYCLQVGRQLSASTFYTDSFSDAEVLRAVGNPVAVNPDVRLRRLARQMRWPIETFRTVVGQKHI